MSKDDIYELVEQIKGTEHQVGSKDSSRIQLLVAGWERKEDADLGRL